jgi:hypothetical protein
LFKLQDLEKKIDKLLSDILSKNREKKKETGAGIQLILAIFLISVVFLLLELFYIATGSILTKLDPRCRTIFELI